jgi:CRISPR-associated protein Csm2
MNVTFWKDRATHQIDPKLFSETAEALAQQINQERMGSRDKLNKPTQIRKFFDEVIRFQGMVQADPLQFAELLPYIKMLNAKAAYAAGRDLIGPEFKGFLSDSLKQVNDQQDFELFCSFFEAFLGFYKYCAEKEKDGGADHGRSGGGYGQQQQRHDNRREPQVIRR